MHACVRVCAFTGSLMVCFFASYLGALCTGLLLSGRGGQSNRASTPSASGARLPTRAPCPRPTLNALGKGLLLAGRAAHVGKQLRREGGDAWERDTGAGAQRIPDDCGHSVVGVRGWGGAASRRGKGGCRHAGMV